MQNEFEKRLQQEMETFSIEPNEQVWQQVELRISERKKKRRALLFWLSGCLCLLLGGAIFYHKTDDINGGTKQFVTTNNQAPVVKSEDGNRQIPAIVDEPGITKANRQEDGTTTISPAPNAADKALRNDDYVRSSKQFIRRMNSIKAQPDNEREVDNNLNMEQPIAQNPVVAKADLPTNSSPKSSDHLVPDSSLSAIKIPVEKDADLKATSSLNQKDSTLPKIAKSTVDDKTSKWKFGITAIAGVSSIGKGVRLAPSAQSFVPGSLSSASPSTGMLNPSFKFEYSSSISVGIGAFAKCNISSRFAFDAGINYQYFSVKTSAGNRIDTALLLYDTSLLRSSSINAYYLPSNNNTYTNRYHFLQMPLNISWQMNRNKDKPIRISAGIAPSVLFASHALYYNKNRRIAYYEKEQFNTFHLFGQAGFSFPLLSGKKILLHAGPFLQYELTNLTKPQVQPVEHLRFIGIRSSIEFK